MLPLLLATIAASSDVPQIPFEKYQLTNGLTVILHHDPRLPLVAVSVWYDVGALHEVKGRSGFAHLFEHMMFQGSLNVGEDKHFAFLENAGATSINGTTDFDRTAYFENVPANYLELALWLESDRMGFLLPSLTQPSLDNQIDVVKNERRQSIENQPYGLMEEMIVQTIYPPEHPYHGNVIGSMDDLSKASLDDVRDFFRSYYSPANATLCIAGNYDPATIKALVEKYFGPLRGRLKPVALTYAAPTIAAEKVIPYSEPVGQLPKIAMVWMGPPIYSDGTAELDLLASMLAGNKSARLTKRLTYDDQIAESVQAYFSEHKSGSQFEIDVVVRPGRTLEEARAVIDSVLSEVKTKGLTAEELTRAKNGWETRFVQSIERLGGHSGRGSLLQNYNLHFQDPGRIGWDLLRYRNATLPAVQGALQTYLNDKRLIVYATPKSAAPRPKGDSK